MSIIYHKRSDGRFAVIEYRNPQNWIVSGYFDLNNQNVHKSPERAAWSAGEEWTVETEQEAVELADHARRLAIHDYRAI